MAKRLEEYQIKSHQRLRLGYTTGSCAAAAAKAAVTMLLSGNIVTEVSIPTPKGILLTLEVLDVQSSESFVSCAIQKDAGDDADVTDGILIYATASYASSPDIIIEGGTGIGRVTRPGLEQPVGAFAINNTPRQMIRSMVADVCSNAGYEGGIRVVISAPMGEEIAAKTFNPRLGIEGGISILGTSGIVEPMSEPAIIRTIQLELRQHFSMSRAPLLLTPGNYGQQFLQKQFSLDLEKSVKCSNYVGEAFDYAYMLGYREILFVGHIGKLVKLAAGIMNTHSKMADARLETLTACAILAGCDADLARKLLSCMTTDEALDLLSPTPFFDDTMKILLEKILYHLRNRTEHAVRIEVILFSNASGLLIQSEHAAELIKKL